MTPATRTRVLYGCAAVALALMVGVLFAVTGLGNAGTTAEGQRDAVVGPAVDQSDRTLVLCQGSSGADVAKALADAGLCNAAREVKAQVSSAGVPTTVTITSAVDPNQLRQYAKAAADSYCAEHEGCKPDTAVLVPIVATYLTQHPPTQPKPSQAEVRAAVQFVTSQNPAAFKGDPGTNGTNGQDAPPVTDDQVAAQVAAYCSDGRCTGAQGASVTDLEFSRNDSGQCEVVVTLTDPADGTAKTVRHGAGDAACTPVPTTTTEPPAGGGGLLGGG